MVDFGLIGGALQFFGVFKMKKAVSYFISLAALVLAFSGCEYLEADDVCADHEEDAVQDCSELNDRLELCNPDEETSVPGCYIKRDCDASGKNCEEYCGGDPVPCDQMDKDACDAAFNCEWWNDPNKLDRNVD